MDFCIYFDYEVTVKNEYCYINEEGDYITEVDKFTKIMDGGSFAKFVSDFLVDRYFSSILISDQAIFVSCFDPLNGTGQDVLIKHKAIKVVK